MTKQYEEIKRLSTQEMLRQIKVIEVNSNLGVNEQIDFDSMSGYNKALVTEYIHRVAKKEQRRIDRKKGRTVIRNKK